MAQAHYINAEGNRIDITLPDYAMEQTQARMLKALEAMVGSDDKSFKLYKEILKESTEYHKNQDKSNDERNEHLKKQTESLNKFTKGSADVYAGKRLKIMGNLASQASDALINLNKIAIGAAITGLGMLASRANTVGQNLAELGQVGIGLEGIGDTTVSTIASLNRLGLSVSEASQLMQSSSAILATIGQQQFTQVNTVLAKMTGSGAKFGMTMGELAALAAEDLEIRQRLGILDQMNASQAARQSAELYQQQMNAATLLGKSIDDIRNASSRTLRENAQFATRVQSIGAKFGPQVARQFTQIIQTGLGDLAGQGLGQGLIDSIGNEIGSAVAFAGDAGTELFRTLNFVNPALVDSVRNMNNLSKAGDMSGLESEMTNFQETLMQTATDMSASDFDALNRQLLNGSLGPAAEEFAQSIAQIRVASQRYGKDIAAQFNDLAVGAKTFDNAMGQFTGGISSIFTDISGALGPAVGGLASAFHDVTDESGNLIDGQIGIGTAFKQAMASVSKTIGELVGGPDGSFENLGDMLRRKVVPAIQGFAKWFADGGGQKMIDTLKEIGNYFMGMIAPIRDLFNLFDKDFDGPALKNTMASFDTLGGKIALAVGSFILVTGALKKFASAIEIGKSITSFMGMGKRGGGAAATAAGGAVGKGGKAAGSGMAAMGAGAAKLGKGLGAGLGGIISGIGKGFAVLGPLAKPIVIGAGALAIAIGAVGGAISLVGAGLGKAAEILGNGVKVLSEGLQTFDNLSGEHLTAVGSGMLSISKGIAAMGAGGVVGALGNIGSNLFDGLNNLFGGDSLMDKVQDFANTDLSIDKLTKNANALQAYADSLLTLSKIDMAKLNRNLSTPVKIPEAKAKSVTNKQYDPFDGVKNFKGSYNLREFAKNSPEAYENYQKDMQARYEELMRESESMDLGPGSHSINMATARAQTLKKYRSQMLKAGAASFINTDTGEEIKYNPPTPAQEVTPTSGASNLTPLETPLTQQNELSKLIEIQQENARLVRELINEQRKANKKAEEQLTATKKLA